MTDPMLIAQTTEKKTYLLPQMANRHGLITGATGTGKTVTLQRLAESFSLAGVPVFVADVKGDLSGIAAAGESSPGLSKHLARIGIDTFTPQRNTTVFWDVYGENGHPVRATISDMGPILLSRLLNLNDTQTGVLQLIFKVADDQGLLLLDLKDLRAMVQYVGENTRDFSTEYGRVSVASIGAIQRRLLTLEEEGAEHFFGEPMLNLEDLIQTDEQGYGVVNVLSAEKLYLSPKLYSTFLLWMLSELFEQLPEIGDPDKPRLVFFFDEAHLLFDDAPDALIEKVEQVVRLIRSKGVGVYFVTQNPLDVPDEILGQLGNRVQHALRAFTPRDQRAVKSAAETMRPNPAFDAADIITTLGVGEALISFLDDEGRPNMVEHTSIIAPGSRLGPLTSDERRNCINASVLFGHYEKAVDRESAYEMLRQKAAESSEHATQASSAPSQQSNTPEGGQSDEGGIFGKQVSELLFGSTGPRGGRHDGLLQTAAKSISRSLGSSIGRQITRGILGSLFGGGRRR